MTINDFYLSLRCKYVHISYIYIYSTLHISLRGCAQQGFLLPGSPAHTTRLITSKKHTTPPVFEVAIYRYVLDILYHPPLKKTHTHTHTKKKNSTRFFGGNFSKNSLKKNKLTSPPYFQKAPETRPTTKQVLPGHSWDDGLGSRVSILPLLPVWLWSLGWRLHTLLVRRSCGLLVLVLTAWFTFWESKAFVAKVGGFFVSTKRMGC